VKEEVSGKVWMNIQDNLVKALSDRFDDMNTKGEKPLMDSSLLEYLDSTYPLIGKLRGQKYVVCAETNRILSMPYPALIQSLRACGKKPAEEYSQKTVSAHLVYDPQSLEGVSTKDMPDVFGKTVPSKVFNTYSPPNWRVYEGQEVDISAFKKLFFHLFPTKQSQAYAGSWIRNCVVERNKNQTILHMSGSRGSGKSTLCVVLSALVGDTNASKFPRGFRYTHFDSYLKDKQLVVMDDIPINKRVYNLLKGVCDDEQMFSIKNQNSEHLQKSPASFIVSTNGLTDTYNEPDNRRGLMPELAETDASTALTADEIGFLKGGLEDDYLYSVAEFFKQYPADAPSNNKAPKTKRFDQTVWATAPTWLSFMRNTLNKGYIGQEYDFTDLCKQLGREVRKVTNTPSSRVPDSLVFTETIETYAREGYEIANVDFTIEGLKVTKIVSLLGKSPMKEGLL
jgi:energy-coupling factor transporter ATP-binding protein EcfA2